MSSCPPGNHPIHPRGITSSPSLPSPGIPSALLGDTVVLSHSLHPPKDLAAGRPHSPLRARWLLPTALAQHLLPPQAETKGRGEDEQNKAGAQQQPGHLPILQCSLQGQAWQETAQLGTGHCQPCPRCPIPAAHTHLPLSAGGRCPCCPPGGTPSSGSPEAASPGSSDNCPYCCTPGRPRGGGTGVQ